MCGTFVAESERILRIDIDGGVWLRPGAAVAYRGSVTFERLHTIDAESLTDAALREMAPLVRAMGSGRLYCAHQGSHARVLPLNGEAIVISWHELLAFEESLDFELSLVSRGVSVAAGGLVVVRLSGRGALAIATHGEPLTLPVNPESPVATDPHATVAWSGNLVPSVRTDLSWRSLFGHGGGEPFQMLFEGTGFVIVQPYKDPSRISARFDPIKQIKTLLAV